MKGGENTLCESDWGNCRGFPISEPDTIPVEDVFSPSGELKGMTVLLRSELQKKRFQIRTLSAQAGNLYALGVINKEIALAEAISCCDEELCDRFSGILAQGEAVIERLFFDAVMYERRYFGKIMPKHVVPVRGFFPSILHQMYCQRRNSATMEDVERAMLPIQATRISFSV